MFILLDVTFVGVISVLFALALMVALIGGISSLMEKYMGVTTTSRTGVKSAIENNSYNEMFVKNMQMQNPNLVNRAMSNCKEKHYSLTYTNISSEILKINKSESKIKAKEAIKKRENKENKSYNGKSIIEELGELNKLYKDGVISHDEFLALKRDVLSS